MLVVGEGLFERRAGQAVANVASKVAQIQPLASRIDRSEQTLQSPLQILVGNDALALGLSLVAVMAWLVTVAYTSARGWHGLMRLFMWGIVITQLVAVHTATTNQIMLMLPIFYVLRRSPALKFWAALGAFLVVPWGVFLLTKQGNVESPLALLPLSIGVAAWWYADELIRLRHAPSRELAT